MLTDAKKLYSSEETLAKLSRGLEALKEKVAPTMGALGRHIIIESSAHTPIIINDGVNIAKQIILDDPLENLGARIGIDAAEETARRVGDSTSLTIIALASLVKQGLDLVRAGANPVRIIHGMNMAMADVMKKVKEQSKEITNTEELGQVAKISSRDESIANLIVQALNFVGNDGVIKKDRTLLRSDYLETRKGMHYQQGFVTSELCRDAQTRISEFNNPFVILLNDDIYKQEQMRRILERMGKVAQNLRTKQEENDEELSPVPFLIITNQISSEGLALAVKNFNKVRKFREAIDVQIVLTPGQNAEDLRANLDDIQAITGGEVLNVDSLVYEEFDKSSLGRLEYAEISESYFILQGLNSASVEGRVLKRVDYLKKRIETNEVKESPRREHALRERISRLTAGIATIYLYAQTDNIWLDRQELLDDALMSTMTARRGGIVAGGGVCLKNVGHELKENFDAITESNHDDVSNGYFAVVGILDAGWKQILDNAGIDAEKPLQDLWINTDDYGLDVSSGKVGDMFELGVVDPANAIMTAMQNAVANAGLLLRIAGGIVYKGE